MIKNHNRKTEHTFPSGLASVPLLNNCYALFLKCNLPMHHLAVQDL